MSPKPFFGVVHLPALPGTARHSLDPDALLEAALADARALAEGGVDGIVVENFGDAPFRKGTAADPVAPIVPAVLAVVARQIRVETGLPLCINVLRNDGCAALAVAAASGAGMVRINVLSGAFQTDQGVIEGEAARVAEQRRVLGHPVRIWADLMVKHAVPLAPLDPLVAAKDLVQRSGADGLIVSGTRTGEPVDGAFLRGVTGAVPGVPVWIGSGLSEDNAPSLWPHCHGAIVGTSLKAGAEAGAPIATAKVKRLARVLASLA